MGEKARVDMDYMCELTGTTEEEIFVDLKGVIFLNPMYGYGNSTPVSYTHLTIDVFYTNAEGSLVTPEKLPLSLIHI